MLWKVKVLCVKRVDGIYDYPKEITYLVKADSDSEADELCVEKAMLKYPDWDSFECEVDFISFDNDRVVLLNEDM